MSDSRKGLRLATYNVEWFNALFDDHGRMLDDREPSTRYKTTRGEQLAALAIVFVALDADGITIIEAPDTNGHRSTVKALETFARAAGIRARKAIIGYPSETEQEIAFLYDPDRLTPRHDPQADLHAAYARVRECLREGEPLAWTLRRFERDLLEALGFGFDFASDGDGAPIDPAARYRLDPEQGPLRVLSERTGERRESATGQGLLALAEDAKPPAEDIASLRLPLRAVLLHHLGGRGLKSWEMLGELGRLAARGEMGSQ